MKVLTFVASVLTVLFLGCAAPKNLVVLAPDEGGAVGALEVKNRKGTMRLDQPGKALYIRDADSLPEEATPISAQEVQRTFGEALAVPLEPPKHYTLYFEFNSDKLTAEGEKTLDAVLAEIDRLASKDIVVTGHTDRAGEKGYNIALSLQRAEMVKAMLTAKGVAPETVRVTSHGENNPLVPTADNVAEPKNRRVEVAVR